jgi:F-type H+-transporting ATPase subunit delta
LIRQSIARRYAQALFGVGEKDGRYMDYLEQMRQVLSVAAFDPKIEKALMLPLIEMDKRKELLSALVGAIGAAPPVAALLGLLLEKRRMNYLPLICDSYREMIDDKEGRARGVCYSAYPVTDEVKQRIEAALADRLGRKVELSIEEDRGLIGGIKVIVGGLRIDGSVKRQLELLNERMMEE